MKKTKHLKKIFTLTAIACLSMAAFFSPVATLSAYASTPEVITPRKDDIKWRFKEENGKLYRRLFNYTTDSWIGEWEYVADL